MDRVTIEKDGEPWMLCVVLHDADIELQIRTGKANAPNATFPYRSLSPIESQHCADAMNAEEGVLEGTFEFFAVLVVDNQTT